MDSRGEKMAPQTFLATGPVRYCSKRPSSTMSATLMSSCTPSCGKTCGKLTLYQVAVHAGP